MMLFVNCFYVPCEKFAVVSTKEDLMPGFWSLSGLL